MSDYNKNSVHYILQDKIEQAVEEVMKERKNKDFTSEQKSNYDDLILRLTDIVFEVYNMNRNQ